MAESIAPRTDLTAQAWLLTEPARKGPKRCCAKCRRGTAADGDLPCGYLGRCPNGCHAALDPTPDAAPWVEDAPENVVDRDSPLVRRLMQLAAEFDVAADEYAKCSGAHNELLRDESIRASEQLQTVADLVCSGEYSQQRGADWLKAAWRIITAIGRANLA